MLGDGEALIEGDAEILADGLAEIELPPPVV